MLAEQDSSIELRLPSELCSAAFQFGGELAWAAPDAAAAVSWLGAHGKAVVGVELWREKAGRPLWLASSDYAAHPAGGPAAPDIAWCAEQAANFIQAHRADAGVLFNLTWDDGRPRGRSEEIL